MSAFPHARYRPGQREALEEAREAFADGHRFVVLEAPTGSGKSAIGVTLAREASSAYLLTAQKLLQDQYARDFPDLAVMKGRANYACLVAPTHAAAAPCIAGRFYPECEACPYFTARAVASNARNTVMNYAYYLAELNHTEVFDRRDLLVLDEAHGVEAALMGFLEVRLSDARLRGAGVAERLPQVLEEAELFDAVDDLDGPMRHRSTQIGEAVAHGALGDTAAVEALGHKRWLDGQLARMDAMRESRDEEDVDWVVERTRDGEGQVVSFRPVEVARMAEPWLFAFGERVLLQSATILDAPTYLRSLGIEEEDAHVIRVASTFAAERRPVVVRPSARLTRHHRDRELPKLVAAVAEVMAEHPEEKGVIHAHAYRIVDALQRGLPEAQRARLVTHRDAAGRDAALARHLGSPDPTVLLTPSMTEGIDLAGDLARWQVICKIPYPYLGDPQVAARRALDPGWYAWRTCLTVVQAYGRSVRSADDHAVTYLLDADVPAWLRREWERFPLWFREAVDAGRDA